MTNRERILKMTVEELLKFVALDVRGKKLHRILSKVMSCANCPVYTACYSETGDKCCSDYIGKWLDKEVQMMTTAKDDKGKLRLSLVPTQIIRDIAQVREYGCQKYHDPENWRQVEVQRYIDAFYRHWLKFIEDPNAIDEESGIPHYKHCACNLAFICEMMKGDKNG